MTRIIAHRGASAAFAEQTRAAYLQAIADGADALECDVQLSTDSVVVCCHDWTVDRTSDGHGRVDEHSLAELRALDFSSWKGAQIPPAYGQAAEQFVTLAELYQIALGAGRPIELAVELKQPSPAGARLDEAVFATLREQGWDPGAGQDVSVTFMSFDPRCVARLSAEVGPAAVCQLLTTEADLARDAVFGPIAQEACSGARGAIDAEVATLAGPSVLLAREEPELVTAWAAQGITVRVWITNDDDDARYLLRLGVQELITDRPAGLRAAIG